MIAVVPPWKAVFDRGTAEASLHAADQYGIEPTEDFAVSAMGTHDQVKQNEVGEFSGKVGHAVPIPFAGL